MPSGACVPVKTAEGQAELGTRRRGLSQRHRTVLLLVDGRRTEDEVRALAAGAGAPAGCYDELLALGLIESRPGATPASPVARPPVASLAGELAPSAPVPLDDTLLPSVRSLPPDTSLHDSVMGGRLPPDSWLPSDADDEDGTRDDVVEQARALLVRAVRHEAPLAGTLTVLRLRRARTRGELTELLADVEARLGRRRSLALAQTIESVRRLLDLGGEARSAA